MNRISEKMFSQGYIKLAPMLNIYSYLTLCQQSNSSINQQDLRTAILLSFGTQAISENDVTIYTSLLLEFCLDVKITPHGKLMGLRIRDSASNEALFFKQLLELLTRKANGRFMQPTIDFLKEQYSSHKFKQAVKTQHIKPKKIQHKTSGQLSAISQSSEGLVVPDPIVKFLASIRRAGMDIMFPQSTHDKVLVCILMAIKAMNAPMAHRDLIEIVMMVKESGRMTEMAAVSKTKVRGILALLKHGEILQASSRAIKNVASTSADHSFDGEQTVGQSNSAIVSTECDDQGESPGWLARTEDARRAASLLRTMSVDSNSQREDSPKDLSEANPVKLSLSETVTTFQELRKRHDDHITRFIAEDGNSELQVKDWSEITWGFAEESSCIKRLKAIELLSIEVRSFIADHFNQFHEGPVEATNKTISVAASKLQETGEDRARRSNASKHVTLFEHNELPILQLKDEYLKLEVTRKLVAEERKESVAESHAFDLAKSRQQAHAADATNRSCEGTITESPLQVEVVQQQEHQLLHQMRMQRYLGQDKQQQLAVRTHESVAYADDRQSCRLQVERHRQLHTYQQPGEHAQHYQAQQQRQLSTAHEQFMTHQQQQNELQQHRLQGARHSDICGQGRTYPLNTPFYESTQDAFERGRLSVLAMQEHRHFKIQQEQGAVYVQRISSSVPLHLHHTQHSMPLMATASYCREVDTRAEQYAPSQPYLSEPARETRTALEPRTKPASIQTTFDNDEVTHFQVPSPSSLSPSRLVRQLRSFHEHQQGQPQPQGNREVRLQTESPLFLDSDLDCLDQEFQSPFSPLSRAVEVFPQVQKKSSTCAPVVAHQTGEVASGCGDGPTPSLQFKMEDTSAGVQTEGHPSRFPSGAEAQSPRSYYRSLITQAQTAAAEATKQLNLYQDRQARDTRSTLQQQGTSNVDNPTSVPSKQSTSTVSMGEDWGNPFDESLVSTKAPTGIIPRGLSSLQQNIYLSTGSVNGGEGAAPGERVRRYSLDRAVQGNDPTNSKSRAIDPLSVFGRDGLRAQSFDYDDRNKQAFRREQPQLNSSGQLWDQCAIFPWQGVAEERSQYKLNSHNQEADGLNPGADNQYHSQQHQTIELSGSNQGGQASVDFQSLPRQPDLDDALDHDSQNKYFGHQLSAHQQHINLGTIATECYEISSLSRLARPFSPTERVRECTVRESLEACHHFNSAQFGGGDPTTIHKPPILSRKTVPNDVALDQSTFHRGFFQEVVDVREYTGVSECIQRPLGMETFFSPPFIPQKGQIENRKLTNPAFPGAGASPSNPPVTQMYSAFLPPYFPNQFASDFARVDATVNESHLRLCSSQCKIQTAAVGNDAERNRTQIMSGGNQIVGPMDTQRWNAESSNLMPISGPTFQHTVEKEGVFLPLSSSTFYQRFKVEEEAPETQIPQRISSMLHDILFEAP